MVAPACGGAMGQVPVRGDDAEVARLAGEWKGQFEGVDNAKTGTIDLNFQLGRHTADARVTLLGASTDGSAMKLKVEYLAVENGTIRGKIEPYVDPECSCKVETEFEGALTGDYIVGTYFARPAAGGERKGQWSAERVD
ncbi:MAG: hypothetical protein D6689_19450 [Deltaproteobacteria bacterium]|nr:MAG: hypothetical protein D6689_19450 [Deltaproteobacteria bacterium]